MAVRRGFERLKSEISEREEGSLITVGWKTNPPGSRSLGKSKRNAGLGNVRTVNDPTNASN